jgi:hypothetical protein
VGVTCSVGTVKYTGGVWHDLVVEKPNCTDTEPAVCTQFYSCINNGCPKDGATKMECKVSRLQSAVISPDPSIH